MFAANNKLLCFVTGATFSLTTFISPCLPQDTGQVHNSTAKTSTAEDYFPAGTPDAAFFASYLSFVGEPSLLDVANDKRVTSFRIDWLSSQHGQVVMVRLTLKDEGDATITSVIVSGSPTVVRRTKDNVSAADVEKFLRVVDRARFWSLPTIPGPKEDYRGDPGHRVVVFDAEAWLIEGVRNGSYHAAFRTVAEPSFFTDIGRYLMKDLAKLDDSFISIPKYPSP
jgi:hypothetical protein